MFRQAPEFSAINFWHNAYQSGLVQTHSRMVLLCCLGPYHWNHIYVYLLFLYHIPLPIETQFLVGSQCSQYISLPTDWVCRHIPWWYVRQIFLLAPRPFIYDISLTHHLVIPPCHQYTIHRNYKPTACALLSFGFCYSMVIGSIMRAMEWAWLILFSRSRKATHNSTMMKQIFLMFCGTYSTRVTPAYHSLTTRTSSGMVLLCPPCWHVGQILVWFLSSLLISLYAYHWLTYRTSSGLAPPCYPHCLVYVPLADISEKFWCGSSLPSLLSCIHAISWHIGQVPIWLLYIILMVLYTYHWLTCRTRYGIALLCYPYCLVYLPLADMSDKFWYGSFMLSFLSCIDNIGWDVEHVLVWLFYATLIVLYTYHWLTCWTRSGLVTLWPPNCSYNFSLADMSDKFWYDPPIVLNISHWLTCRQVFVWLLYTFLIVLYTYHWLISQTNSGMFPLCYVYCLL